METKHTKGEWKVSKSDCLIYSVRQAEKRHGLLTTDIVRCQSIDHKVGKEEAEANAKLIAAAPELLEALLVVQKHLSGKEVLTHPERLIDWVNEAIEKATVQS